MTHPMLEINGLEVPRFLYGTAWKEDQTQRLAELALEHGFRGIDTANQRRHYNEAAVGQAVSAAIADGKVTRDELFLQTKFTFQRSQDHRLPYVPEAPIATQVEQSCTSSLEHLGVKYVDSYLLHGPASSAGLTGDDWQAWRAMEALHEKGRTRLLGVSNVDLDQLQQLCSDARIPPRFVQNRCFAVLRWDRQVRQFCREHGIVYQGFSLLTANRPALASEQLARIAASHDRTIPQIVFRFALEVGMIPLTGTTNPEHMRADLDVFGFQLDQEEIATIENVAAG